MIKVLLLPKYGTAGPSSRYRFYQYLKTLEEAGFDCTISPLFSNKYVKDYYKTGDRNFWQAVYGYLRRVFILFSLRRYQLLFIEYELFPGWPSWFEKLLKRRGVKYIVDYDDAIYTKYEDSQNSIKRFFLKDKIVDVISCATVVITGNQMLCDHALKHNTEVTILPTVVSKALYDNQEDKSDKTDFIIGWIGSRSTSAYLKIVAEPLKNANLKNIRIKLIGAQNSAIDLFSPLPVELVEWSEETEIKEIKSFSVGIMPLEDDPWSRGKCGFKLIQYMAAGKPVIATPVGVNREIVVESLTGFLVETEEEWIRSIKILKDHPEVAETMGNCGYKRFSEHYSFEQIAPRYVELFKQILS